MHPCSTRFCLLLSMGLLLTGCLLPRQGPLEESRNDSVVSAEVEATLAGEGPGDFSGILVATDRGTVTLLGTVQRAEQKARAAELARQIKGVKRVKNDVEIHATATP